MNKKLIYKTAIITFILGFLGNCCCNGLHITYFNADPNTILSGESTTLTWNTEAAEICHIDNGLGNQPVNGSINVSPTTTTTYTLTATCTSICNDEKVTAQVTVTVYTYDNCVLEWLELVQDLSTNEKKLLASMSYQDYLLQTYNNSLAAMAFILKDEKDRAERILDFYEDATVIDNNDIKLQNFYYNGEARGFYQQAIFTNGKYERAGDETDRWIGDMAFLLIACKYYEKKYNSTRYQELIDLIRDLFISFYIDYGDGGYIQHGWRKGDSYLHESEGHPEGNVDCCAALKLCGIDGDIVAQQTSERIKIWLDGELNGSNTVPGYPLDLFAWRALLFGGDYCRLLDIPEDGSNNYKKTVIFNGKSVTGFYHIPAYIENIWVDGTAHMACAYIHCNNKESGDFYIVQLNKLLIKTIYEGKTYCALPYTTTNDDDNYKWVDTSRGFVSTAAWYIFTKNSFNPFLLSQYLLN